MRVRRGIVIGYNQRNRHKDLPGSSIDNKTEICPMMR